MRRAGAAGDGGTVFTWYVVVVEWMRNRLLGAVIPHGAAPAAMALPRLGTLPTRRTNPQRARVPSSLQTRPKRITLEWRLP